jgi:FkbM family methyltransferase
LRDGDVVLDLGANVGFFTLLYARQVGSNGHVHAFEPGIQSFALLQSNVAVNALSNVTTHHAAVGDQDGEGQILLCRTDDSDNKMVDNPAKSATPSR